MHTLTQTNIKTQIKESSTQTCSSMIWTSSKTSFNANWSRWKVVQASSLKLITFSSRGIWRSVKALRIHTTDRVLIVSTVNRFQHLNLVTFKTSPQCVSKSTLSRQNARSFKSPSPKKIKKLLESKLKMALKTKAWKKKQKMSWKGPMSFWNSLRNVFAKTKFTMGNKIP